MVVRRPRAFSLSFPSLALLFVVVGAGVGCAASTETPAKPASAPPPAAADSASVAPKRAIPAGQIRREDVMAFLSGGPGAFLAKVEVEPVLGKDNTFRGWRVVEIRDPELVSEHLVVGDIITRVNDRKIEREGEFYDVFMAMAFAPELRVATLRGGQARGFTLPINDDPSAPPVPLAAASATTGAQTTSGRRR
jgi:S1-C subfamily serine protease